MDNSLSQTSKARNGSASQIRRVAYIEFYVGNANQAAHFYRSVFGFRPVSYSALETGNRECVSYVLEQADIRLVLTSAIDPDSPISEHVRLHGDSVKDIAFEVNDAAAAFEDSVKRGAQSVMEPARTDGDEGSVIKATIRAFGQTVHSFIQTEGVGSLQLPGYSPLPSSTGTKITGLKSIDHIAISVEQGELDRWVDFYTRVLGFHQSHQEDVATEYSAMRSKVVQNANASIKFPMMEPAAGKRRSQIEEFLNFHRGAGAQHVALLTDEIVGSVCGLRGNCMDFLKTPNTYYDALEARVGSLGNELEALRRQHILVDRDEWGLLLQIFTRPVQSRPTLFFEVIQRLGARGFGGGNIKALFEALEREQAMRGTL
jgi:4-hydroxyphenylpyruvate dioxygenase